MGVNVNMANKANTSSVQTADQGNTTTASPAVSTIPAPDSGSTSDILVTAAGDYGAQAGEKVGEIVGRKLDGQKGADMGGKLGKVAGKYAAEQAATYVEKQAGKNTI